MKFIQSQTDEASLLALGEQASAMLMQRNYSGLANRFGYALAFDRAPSMAIEADFLKAVASPIKAVFDAHPLISIKYFAPNDTGLFAVVECTVPVTEGTAVLLELVITATGEEKHITVEDISGANA